MKKCNKCGFENPNEANFCVKCGAKLNNKNLENEKFKICPRCGTSNLESASFCKNCKYAFNKNANDKKVIKRKYHHKILIIFMVIIVILLFIISFILGTKSIKQGLEKKPKIEKVQNKTSSKSISSSSKKLISKTSTKELNANTISPEKEVAAIIYFGSHNIGEDNAWLNYFNSYNSFNVTIQKMNDNDKNSISEVGAGLMYMIDPKNGIDNENTDRIFYVLSKDWKNVYFYTLSNDDGNNVYNFKTVANLDEIVNYVNSNDAEKNINNLARNITIIDNSNNENN